MGAGCAVTARNSVFAGTTFSVLAIKTPRSKRREHGGDSCRRGATAALTMGEGSFTKTRYDRLQLSSRLYCNKADGGIIEGMPRRDGSDAVIAKARIIFNASERVTIGR